MYADISLYFTHTLYAVYLVVFRAAPHALKSVALVSLAPQCLIDFDENRETRITRPSSKCQESACVPNRKFSEFHIRKRGICVIVHFHRCLPPRNSDAIGSQSRVYEHGGRSTTATANADMGTPIWVTCQPDYIVLAGGVLGASHTGECVFFQGLQSSSLWSEAWWRAAIIGSTKYILCRIVRSK